MGRTPCSKSGVRALYGRHSMVSPTYRDAHIRPMNDLFSLSEACLLADTFQGLMDLGFDFEPSAVVDDVSAAIRHAHVSGAMQREVMLNQSKYIDRSDGTLQFLQGLKAAGKRLFLVSNSGHNFVDHGMSYIVGSDWKELFDVVVVSADKPRWYTDPRRPFRAISERDGRSKWARVTSLKQGTVYTGGSIAALQALTGWRGGRVLYFGDSLWADLVAARREHGWYTGAIIGELDDELAILRSPEYTQLKRSATALMELLRVVQNCIGRDHLFGAAESVPEADDEILAALEAELDTVKRRMRTVFNANFGSVFRTVAGPTVLGFAVGRYCDICKCPPPCVRPPRADGARLCRLGLDRRLGIHSRLWHQALLPLAHPQHAARAPNHLGRRHGQRLPNAPTTAAGIVTKFHQLPYYIIN